MSKSIIGWDNAESTFLRWCVKNFVEPEKSEDYLTERVSKGGKVPGDILRDLREKRIVEPANYAKGVELLVLAHMKPDIASRNRFVGEHYYELPSWVQQYLGWTLPEPPKQENPPTSVQAPLYPPPPPPVPTVTTHVGVPPQLSYPQVGYPWQPPASSPPTPLNGAIANLVREVESARLVLGNRYISYICQQFHQGKRFGESYLPQPGDVWVGVQNYLGQRFLLGVMGTFSISLGPEDFLSMFYVDGQTPQQVTTAREELALNEFQRSQLRSESLKRFTSKRLGPQQVRASFWIRDVFLRVGSTITFSVKSRPRAERDSEHVTLASCCYMVREDGLAKIVVDPNMSR